MIENIVIDNGNVRDSDIPTLYGDEEVIRTTETDIPRLLVQCGIYKSTTQARNAGRQGKVPDGWTEFKASKKRRLFIWNPTD